MYMHKVEIEPSWMERIDARILSWIQKRLDPKDECENSLQVKDAMRVTFYFGDDAVTAYIAPGQFWGRCERNGYFVELPFISHCPWDSLDDDDRTMLKDFDNAYEYDESVLLMWEEILLESGWDAHFLKCGAVQVWVPAERNFQWNEKNQAVDPESLDQKPEGFVYAIIYHNGPIYFMAGSTGQLSPALRADAEWSELLNGVAKACQLSTPVGEAEDMLNKVFLSHLDRDGAPAPVVQWPLKTHPCPLAQIV